jgi:hypothetical protein
VNEEERTLREPTEAAEASVGGARKWVVRYPAEGELTYSIARRRGDRSRVALLEQNRDAARQRSQPPVAGRESPARIRAIDLLPGPVRCGQDLEQLPDAPLASDRIGQREVGMNCV